MSEMKAAPASVELKKITSFFLKPNSDYIPRILIGLQKQEYETYDSISIIYPNSQKGEFYIINGINEEELLQQ